MKASCTSPLCNNSCPNGYMSRTTDSSPQASWIASSHGIPGLSKAAIQSRKQRILRFRLLLNASGLILSTETKKNAS